MSRPAEIRGQLSWVAIPIRCTFNGREIGIATGFVFEHSGRTFLVTNYHVVTGRDPVTGKPLDEEHSAVPDALVVGVPFKEKMENGAAIQWRWQQLALYETEPFASPPVWVEHPKHGRRFDGVMIPLAGWEDTAVTPANSARLDLDLLRLYPGLDAFVVGYPQGMAGGGRFPIWKRATIATEPDIDLDGLPKLYVDTATRKGMSGAPVYAQEVGYWIPEGSTDPNDAVLGKGIRFLGLYAGRIGSDEFQAQLGVVWKETGLVELAEAALGAIGHA